MPKQWNEPAQWSELVRVYQGNPLGEEGRESATFLGTAFFVSDTELLTCAHVVDRASGKQIYLLGGSLSQTGVVSLPHEPIIHPNQDVVLFRLNPESKGDGFIRLATNSGRLTTGTELRLAGFQPGNQAVNHSKTHVASYNGADHLVHTDTPVNKGMSGGLAMLDGSAIGMIRAKDAAQTMIIPVSMFQDWLSEHCKTAVFDQNPPQDGSENANRNEKSLAQLRDIVVGILGWEEVRITVLRFNCLPSDWSATQLADEIFKTCVPTAENQADSEPVTPIDFIHQCAFEDDLRESEQWGELCRQMIRLAAVLAPVSFVVDVPSVQSHLDPGDGPKSSHIPANSSSPLLAKSLPARVLGAEVDFDEHALLFDLDSGREDETSHRLGNRLITGIATVPEAGIDGVNLINNISIGISRTFGLRNSTLSGVNGRLAARKKKGSRLCLLLHQTLAEDQLTSIADAFPDLIVLVLGRDEDVHIEMVLNQIDEIQQFFCHETEAERR